MALTWKQKLAYGCGETSSASMNMMMGFYQNYFLVDVACLSPATAAMVLLITKVWDAIVDPIIGYLSDRTTHRLGRRRSWMCFCCIPMGIFFMVQWITLGSEASEGVKAFYYIVVGCLLDTFGTGVNMPYAALAADLTSDFHERTVLNKYRFTFSVQSGVLGIVVLGGTARVLGKGSTAYLVSALIITVIFIWGCTGISVFGLTERYMGEDLQCHLERIDKKTRDSGGLSRFRRQMWYAFRSSSFRSLLCMYLGGWLSVTFVQNFLAFYFKYVLGLSDWFTPCIVMLLQSTFLWMVLWVPIAKRIGKKRAFYAGAVSWVLVLVVLFFLPSNNMLLTLVVCLFSGPGIAACWIMPWAMLPDVCDADEAATGERKEGIFYGYFSLIQQLGNAIGTAVGNAVLTTRGFEAHGDSMCAASFEISNTARVCDIVADCSGQGVCVHPNQIGETACDCSPGFIGPNCDQPSTVEFAMRGVVSCIPLGMVAVACIALYFYPIDQQMHEAHLETIAKRKADETVAEFNADNVLQPEQQKASRGELALEASAERSDSFNPPGHSPCDPATKANS